MRIDVHFVASRPCKICEGVHVCWPSTSELYCTPKLHKKKEQTLRLEKNVNISAFPFFNPS